MVFFQYFYRIILEDVGLIFKSKLSTNLKFILRLRTNQKSECGPTWFYSSVLQLKHSAREGMGLMRSLSPTLRNIEQLLGQDTLRSRATEKRFQDLLNVCKLYRIPDCGFRSYHLCQARISNAAVLTPPSSCKQPLVHNPVSKYD